MTTIHCRIDSGMTYNNGKLNLSKCELWADKSEDGVENAVENMVALSIAEAIKERIAVITRMSESLFVSPVE